MELHDLPKALALSSGIAPGSQGYILNAPPGHCWEEESGDGPMSTEL